MPDVNQLYEEKLKSNIIATNRAIKKIYTDAINEITLSIPTIKYKGIPFALKDYPALKKRVEALLQQMNADIFALTVNSIESSWGISNAKNNVLIDQRLNGKRPVKSVRKIIYDPNKPALQQFLDRRESGMKLSDRVWRNLQPLRNELEQSLGFSIAKGEPAATTATQIKKYLNEPNRLFRRVRTDEGKLVLSEAARNYHPGKGIYRSSYKNALRLARTENNMAYRKADHERWKTLPFVVGVDVKLSAAHPRYDICDVLAGKYPKDFLFRGWHAQCICYATPVMASDADFEKMEDALLNGDALPGKVGGVITKPHAGFKEWIKDNKERVKGWGTTPYFMTDNKKFI